MDLLKIHNVTKRYRKKHEMITAVDCANFSVKKGEFVAIVGESGSGKSTLLQMIGGLESPSEGSIVLDTTNLYALNDDQLAIFRRRQIGMIYQFYNLIPTLNVKENILLPLLLDNKEVEQSYLNKIITILHLEKDLYSYPGQLSGGQQQRVAIARALIHHPTLVLADEPTGNLDSMNTREIVDLLKLICLKEDTTILMITHDMNVAMQADRIYSMEQGRIREFEDAL